MPVLSTFSIILSGIWQLDLPFCAAMKMMETHIINIHKRHKHGKIGFRNTGPSGPNLAAFSVSVSLVCESKDGFSICAFTKIHR